MGDGKKRKENTGSLPVTKVLHFEVRHQIDMVKKKERPSMRMSRILDMARKSKRRPRRVSLPPGKGEEEEEEEEGEKKEGRDKKRGEEGGIRRKREGRGRDKKRGGEWGKGGEG
jgi:hypothetical protein